MRCSSRDALKYRNLSMKRLRSIWLCAFCGILVLAMASCGSTPVVQPAKSVALNRLKVSDNHHYLVDAKTGAPFFILADTAWNLGALKLEEIETYLQSREEHGFNTIMFALNFAPQASETNAYGQPAYIGADKTGLN